MKRLFSLAMVLALMYAMTSSAMADISMTSIKSYGGYTEVPTLQVNIHRAANADGGETLILNPYAGDAQGGTNARWIRESDKTLTVISRPVWVENRTECPISITVKNLKATTSNANVTVVTTPLKKATATKQVFLYLAAVREDESATQPDEDDVTFPAYAKSANMQMFTSSLNTESKSILRLPAPSQSGLATWGAIKICGSASGTFTNPAIQWQTNDTVNVDYTMEIRYSA